MSVLTYICINEGKVEAMSFVDFLLIVYHFLRKEALAMRQKAPPASKREYVQQLISSSDLGRMFEDKVQDHELDSVFSGKIRVYLLCAVAAEELPLEALPS